MFSDLLKPTKITALLLGFISGSYLVINLFIGAAISLISLLIIVFLFKRKSLNALFYLSLSLFCALLIISMRLSSEANQIRDITNSPNNILIGEIIEPPVQKNSYSAEIVVQVENTSIKAIGNIPLYPSIFQGDKVYVESSLELLSENDSFSKEYTDYLKTKNIIFNFDSGEIISIEKSSLSNLRRNFEYKIDGNLTNKNSSLLKGLLFGNRSSLTEDEKKDLLVSGTLHIIAASGFNVTIFYILIVQMLGNSLPRKLLLIFGILSILIYIFIIGTYIYPALRAAIMLSYLLFARLLGRKGSVIVGLLLSIVCIGIMVPNALINISMILSICATLGLLLFTKPINIQLNKSFLKNSLFLKEIISASFATILGTLPISIWSFGSISTVSIFSNIFILPIVSLTSYAGILLIFVGILKVSFLSLLITYFLENALSYILIIISLFGKFESSVIQLDTINSKGFSLVLLSVIYIYYAKKYLFTRNT